MADWDKITSMGDVEDRRGASPLLIGGGGLGLAGAAIVLFLNLFFGGGTIDMNSALEQLQQSQAGVQSGQSTEFEGLDTYEKFSGAVLGSANDTWSAVFAQSGGNYNEPKLVLFRNYTTSACGGASAQVGPHYCPADQTIYLDETFFDELTKRFGAQGGDVAQAYVIAHEVGHHVQHELGTLEQQASGSNDDSIRLELQADCFAGIWAYSVSQKGIFEAGEIREAIDAAAAVGDDRIQQKVQGRVNPESWTHGSSEQRVDAFNVGYTTGKPSNCQI